MKIKRKLTIGATHFRKCQLTLKSKISKKWHKTGKVVINEFKLISKKLTVQC